MFSQTFHVLSLCHLNFKFFFNDSSSSFFSFSTSTRLILADIKSFLPAVEAFEKVLADTKIRDFAAVFYGTIVVKK